MKSLNFSTCRLQDCHLQTWNYTRPIEASAILVSTFEFLIWNTEFAAITLEMGPTKGKPEEPSNLVTSLLTLSSYILCHATSSKSLRALSYAEICLRILLFMTEDPQIIKFLLLPTSQEIHICRQVGPNHSSPRILTDLWNLQRRPIIPAAVTPRESIGALLDCCILWMRHNLHKRLDVHCYM